MHYEYCSRTDVGRVRTNNEDAVCIDTQTNVFVLADGMGGYLAGEVAADMATTQVCDDMKRWLAELPKPLAIHHVRSALEICVENANRAIFDAARKQPQCAGMGTTLVAGVLCGDQLVLAHVGDSRCYRVRAGGLDQLTRDHSWLQQQLDFGLITAQQAAVSTQRNLVTRALGVARSVRVEVNEHALQSGDLLLLCSDGLSEMLHADELCAMADSNAPLQGKAERLVEAANHQGGRDNISVLLVQVGPAPEGRPDLPPLAPQRPHPAHAALLAKRPKRSLLARWLRLS